MGLDMDMRPLHVAVSRYRAESCEDRIIRCLVEEGGADVNDQSTRLASPLLFALGNLKDDAHTVQLVALLLDLGADPNRGLVDLPVPGAVARVLSNVYQIDDESVRAHVFRLLLAAGADPGAYVALPGQGLSTALHSAASRLDPVGVGLMLR